jgi:hypothetical protein
VAQKYSIRAKTIYSIFEFLIDAIMPKLDDEYKILFIDGGINAKIKKLQEYKYYRIKA